MGDRLCAVVEPDFERFAWRVSQPPAHARIFEKQANVLRPITAAELRAPALSGLPGQPVTLWMPAPPRSKFSVVVVFALDKLGFASVETVLGQIHATYRDTRGHADRPLISAMGPRVVFNGISRTHSGEFVLSLQASPAENKTQLKFA